jgi:hypothetical protein
MPPSSGARFYVACANGPAESGVACLLAPRRERRGFSLGPLSTSSAAVHACSGDVANAQIAVVHRRCGGGIPGQHDEGVNLAQAARRPLAWLRPLNSIFLDHYATSLADICAILLGVCLARHGGNAKDRGDPGCGHRRLQPARRRRRGAHTRAPPGPAQRSDRPYHHRATAAHRQAHRRH